jgi:hypothetical protein
MISLDGSSNADAHLNNDVKNNLPTFSGFFGEINTKRICKEFDDNLHSLFPFIVPKRSSCPPQISFPSKISKSNFKYKKMLYEKLSLTSAFFVFFF